MSAENTPTVPTVNVQIDGVWMQFPKGTKVIDACNQSGREVPHYCYHPKLSTPGNCRMCLIEMGMPKMGPDRKPVLGADGKPELNWMPRPQISCAMEVSEGLGVRTSSPLVQECRQGVMEFLLINHPLDCPICDQAGECKLQEFSVDHGNACSNFLERKIKKPKNVELGPRVTLDAERCILCTRCIRFMREVAHDDCIGIVDRGTYNTIACHPDKPLVSNYSLNTVDICPVGALTSEDFRFKMRVWFLKETKSICTSCATGCNTIIGARQEQIYRQTPRENNDVNQVWMCDHGRLNFHYLHREDRFTAPLVFGSKSEWPAAIAIAASEIRDCKGDEVAIIASGRMTNEELFLVKKLAQSIGTTLVDIVPHTGEADDILLSADRNPNTTGAKLLGVATGRLGEITDAAKAGRVKLVLALGEDVAACGIELVKVRVVAMNILPDATTAAASVVLASSGFAEKRGSMINKNGRLQRLNRAIQPPGDARDDWEILRDLISAVGGSNGLHAIEDLFRQMAAETPAFTGLSLSKIGDLGVQLEGVK
jgi:NADH-quinone oxidoreductase subunit G